ncbi:Ig-like domain-containing protein [Psychrobacillus sp. NPDC058041]|uniref:Ig-like domain-containing protein n=1 Tax=Psychrobacillus sp. NPDC058041 TaxID=3346310 RepID=UPI0036DA13EE
MKHTILSIFTALFLLSSHSPVYASDLAGNTVIQLEDSMLQKKLEDYVNFCDHQYDEETTIDRISSCVEKNNGVITLGNWYSGTITTFKGMEKLAGLPIKQLIIQNSHESGDPTDLTPLSKIKSLESLYLSGTYANDFSPLGELSNLSELVINSAHNQPLLTISSIKNLQKLDLSGKQVTSLAGIESMQQLTDLAITGLSIPDFSELTKAPQLTKLFIDFNGSSRFLQSLPNLESLTLFNNNKSKVFQGDDLKKATKLKYLRLDGIEVNYDFLNVMPTLEELKISDSLKDASTLFDAINNPLVHLRNIDLSYNQLSAMEGAKKMSYLFPSIENIIMYRNEITDLSQLVQTDIPYQHLKELEINYNNIFNINLLGEHAELFPSLETINANSNYIHSISEMTKLPALQSLLTDFNFIDRSDVQNPANFVGSPQYQLGTPKTLELFIGSVYSGFILEKFSIPNGGWKEKIKSKDLNITFSDPEVAEITEKGNILAKKAGTTTVTASIIGSTDPYFSHSFLLTVKDEYYKPYDPMVYGDVTLQTNKLTLAAYEEEGKVVVAGNGKVIAIVESSGNLTLDLPSLEGLTELQVWAESKLGIKSNIITVPVYKTEKPEMPSIDSITDQNEYITGKAEPNTTIYVSAAIQDKLFQDQSQKVNADGTFKFYTGKLPSGYSLVFYTKNEEGRESYYISSTVRDLTPPEVPTFDIITSDSKQISGKTEANAKVTIYKNSNYIGYTFADKNGVFEYWISAPIPGDIFTAFAEDKYKNKSEEGRIVVTYKLEKPQPPKIDFLSDQNEYITGKAEPNTTIYVSAESQDELFRDQSQKVKPDGTFKFYSGKLPDGYSLVFYAKNEEGRESDYIRSTVRDITPPAVPAFDPVTSDSKQISGKTEANAKVTIYKNSKYIGDTFADQNGVFKYSISAPIPGDIFTAIAEDKHANKSKEGKVVATLPIKEEIKPQKPVFWKGLELKKGQIGLVTITKRINLWKREGDKLVFERVLNPGEVYRVYRYDSKYGGQYGVGGSLYITNIKGYVKYETPSKAVLAQVK